MVAVVDKRGMDFVDKHASAVPPGDRADLVELFFLEDPTARVEGIGQDDRAGAVAKRRFDLHQIQPAGTGDLDPVAPCGLRDLEERVVGGHGYDHVALGEVHDR